MAGNDWLAHDRGQMAAERILDAAGELFAGQEPGTVGMHQIAEAAGCSRATVYRYFETRDALNTAYVHREARALYQRLTESLAGIADPRQRLITGITSAITLVRGNPALASWFARTEPLGGEMAGSEVITTMVTAFLMQLGGRTEAPTETPDLVERRARWVVRVLTSLLIFPGRDAADEAAMLEQFLAPLVLPDVVPRRLS